MLGCCRLQKLIRKVTFTLVIARWILNRLPIAMHLVQYYIDLGILRSESSEFSGNPEGLYSKGFGVPGSRIAS